MIVIPKKTEHLISAYIQEKLRIDIELRMFELIYGRAL